MKISMKVKILLINGTFPVPQKELGGGFKYFLFSPLFGEDSQFD